MDPVLGAALATGAISLFGGERSNRLNAREAQKNRDFQERMSSTAAQRAVRDYTAAGLNPALAYDRPASSPGGSQAVMEDSGSKAVSSGVSAALARKNIEVMDTQADKNAAEAAKTRVDGANSAATGELLEIERRLKGNELAFRMAIQPHQTRAAALENMMTNYNMSKAAAESAYYRFMGGPGVGIERLASPMAGLAGGLGLGALSRGAGGMMSSGKSASRLFVPPKPRRTGDWERYSKVAGPFIPRR